MMNNLRSLNPSKSQSNNVNNQTAFILQRFLELLFFSTEKTHTVKKYLQLAKMLYEIATQISLVDQIEKYTALGIILSEISRTYWRAINDLIKGVDKILIVQYQFQRSWDVNAFRAVSNSSNSIGSLNKINGINNVNNNPTNANNYSSLHNINPNIPSHNSLHSHSHCLRLKDICMIGISLINVIKNFHQRDYLHRNVTPETFSFGIGEKISSLYINDLIFMKKFRVKNSFNHIQYKENVKIQHLSPFQSINVIFNRQSSRRDDMISIVYVLIYLLKGKLPWQQDWQQQISMKRYVVDERNRGGVSDVNVGNNCSINDSNVKVFNFNTSNSNSNNNLHNNPNQNNNKNSNNKRTASISQQKQQSLHSKLQRRREIQSHISPIQLCRQLPMQIQQLLQLVNQLDFYQQPQYIKYQSILRKILYKNKFTNDGIYQWMQSKQYINNNLSLQNQKIISLQTIKSSQLENLIFKPYQGNVTIDSTFVDGVRRMNYEQNNIKNGNNNNFSIDNNKIPYGMKKKLQSYDNQIQANPKNSKNKNNKKQKNNQRILQNQQKKRKQCQLI